MNKQFNEIKDINIGLTKTSEVFDEHKLALIVNSKVVNPNIFTYSIDSQGAISFLSGHDPLDFLVSLPYVVAKATGNIMKVSQMSDPWEGDDFGWYVEYDFSLREWTINFTNRPSTTRMISGHTTATKISRALNKSTLIKNIIKEMIEGKPND